MPPPIGPIVNISRLIDNQAEASIAVNPTNPLNLFAVTMTVDGNVPGVADPAVNVTNVFVHHTPGFLVAFSNNGGVAGSWNRRIMLTGGPTELSAVEASFPAALADPQAVFDDFGNLYLVYLSVFYQFGRATSGRIDTLTDFSRNWVPNSWSLVPMAVSGPTPNSQFLPSIGVDQLRGHGGIVWLSTQEDINNVKVRLYGTASLDGGATFMIPFPMAAAQSDATVLGMGYIFDYGDYTGLAYGNGIFYPVWPDNSNSTNDNPDFPNNQKLDLYTTAVFVAAIPPPPPL